MSTQAETSTGVEASYEPVDWSPRGLPGDPDEIIAWLMDPLRSR